MLRVDGGTVRLARRLRDTALAWLGEAPRGDERAARAVVFVLEVARLLAPVVRLRAQADLEASSAEKQRRALSETEEAPPRELPDSVGRLLALVAGGSA